MKKLLLHPSCHALDIVLGAVSPHARTAQKNGIWLLHRASQKKSVPASRAAFLKVVLDEDSRLVLLVLSQTFFSHGEREWCCRAARTVVKFPSQHSSRSQLLGSSLLLRDGMGPQQR